MKSIAKMTTAELEAEAIHWSEQPSDMSDEELDRWSAVETELDARELGNHEGCDHPNCLWFPEDWVTPIKEES